MDSTCIDPRDISYRPTAIADPPGIALVACGGITRAHCQAYAAAGYQVRVMCDLDLATAEARRDEFYPHATATTDLAASLARDDIAIVDIAAHPDARPALIRAALEAGKHVLSQKPFVTDLDLGEELCQLAEQRGLKLAVNQNGRWAPHWQWTRNAVAAGLIGPVHSCNFALSWDHNGVADNSPFNRVQ
ncbi:MAG: Gfo/Idh/MocA family oxidoreductase, partial [Planctomycetota bacterium]|nr:Gfo/Idh/MocA family oxidoreductase [Planctomycetota bacterium]